ncbi:MAG: thiamine phosphate synthase [Chlorobiaceae bacterium]|nr:thiamine phosphate synthase [Chlorobiaceae bacterium]
MKYKKLLTTPLPRLFMISSGEADTDKGTLLFNQLNLLPESLPCMVQIREKRLAARELLILTERARAIKLPAGSLLLCNERMDIALAAGLEGVHLPEGACRPDRLRTVAPVLIFGCSIHSLASLRIAEEKAADYLLFGPIFDTPSKRKYGAPQGLEKLGEICRATSLPVFALGGITPQNAALCMDKGAYGTAGLSIFCDTLRLAETLEQFYRILYP